MTVGKGKCVLCGKLLDGPSSGICAECLKRYRRKHPHECAEACIRTNLKGIRSDVCLVCGDPISAFSTVPVCTWCMEYIIDAEARKNGCE